jgi:hypothetical protein
MWSWPDLRYYPVFCLEVLKKTTKNLGQNCQYRSRDLNPGPPEYETGMLTTQPRRSVPEVQKQRKRDVFSFCRG